MNDKLLSGLRMMRTNTPGAYEMFVRHIEHQREEANTMLVNAIPEEVLRQNQGKVQILNEILDLLRN